MSLAAGQPSSRSAAPTRRTSAPRKRGDDTRSKVVDEGVARLVESLSSADVSELPLRGRIEVVVDTAWSCYSSPMSLAAFEILRANRGGPDESSRRHLLEMNEAI